MSTRYVVALAFCASRWLRVLLIAAAAVPLPLAAAAPVCTISAPWSICPGLVTPGTAPSVPDAGAGATYSWTVTNAMIAGGNGTRSILLNQAGLSGNVGISVTVTSPDGSSTCTATVPIAACQNGGICYGDGYCNCTPGYSGTRCQTPIASPTAVNTATPWPTAVPTKVPTAVPTAIPTAIPTRIVIPTATPKRGGPK